VDIPRKKLQPEVTTRGWLDIAPQKYGDLMPSYREVPDDKNAARLVMKAAEALQNWEEMREQWKKYTRNGQWNGGYWDKALKENTKALQMVEQASRMPYIQIEKPIQIDVSTKALMDLMKVMKFLNYRVVHVLESGNVAEAMRYIEMANQLSRLAMEADGGLIGWLVGVASYQQTFEMMERVVDHPKCRAADLRKLDKLLGNISDVHTRFKEAFCYEFLMFNNLYNGMYIGGIVPDDIIGLNGNDGVFRRVTSVVLLRVLLQPNKSIHKHAQIIRYGHKLGKTPSWKRDQLRKPAVVKWVEQKPDKLDYLSFNAIGDVLLKLGAPLVIKQTKKIDRHLVQLRFLRIKMAMRAYYIKNGALPDSLNDLVLPAKVSWLTDPYDGKQIRYSSKKWRVWSCGEDRKDAGGLDGKKTAWKRAEKENEPTCLLEFAR